MTSARRLLPRIGLALALAAGIGWAAAQRRNFDVAAVMSGIAALGAWAPSAYMGLYVVATVLFLPGAILGLAGGALFGPVWGAVYTLIGATVGATLAFLAARYVAADWVAHKAGGRLQQLMAGVEAEGWRFVAFVRLVPLFPFNLLNYALGLTRIRLADYALASFVAMAPGTIAYTYLGYAGREALAGGEAMVRKGLIALALLAVAAFAPRLVGRLRAQRASALPQRGRTMPDDPSWIEAPQLADRLGREPRPLVIDVREPDEFAGEFGHLAGARNLPLSELPRKLGDLDRFKDRQLVLVCRTQIRSAKAAAILMQAGFAGVAVLRGGMERWRQADLPVDDRAG